MYFYIIIYRGIPPERVGGMAVTTDVWYLGAYLGNSRMCYNIYKKGLREA